jgi:ubiquitin carboxyl-terminal hydrolase 34
MLFIHLQRIVFDMDTFLNKKLNNRIEFPNVLDMRPYMKAEVLKQERIAKKGEGEKKAEGRANDQTLEPRRMNENNKEDENESIRNPSVKRVEKEDAMMNDGAEGNAEAQAVDLSKEDHEYKLVGVVVHMGTADAGHYLSYINISRGEKDEENPEWLLTEKDKWLEFNDSSVRQYNFQNIESDCFGGGASSATNEFGVAETVDYTKNAYMLVYEKRRKEPIKVVITEDVARVME